MYEFSNIIGRRRSIPSPARPVGMKKHSPGPVNSFIRMSAKKITLSLQQIGGQMGTAVSVKIGKG
jgi:hypothetical protein